MKKKVVIYDCDGVLFDSREAILAYYNFICDSFHIPRIDLSDKKMVEAAMIKTNDEIINLLTNDKELIKKILEFCKKQNFHRFLPLMKPEKNILTTLERLKKAGIKLSVFTNRGSSLSYLLEHFGMSTYFDYTVNCFAVNNPKPHPEGLFKILSYFDVQNKDAIYVGDSMNDYLPAKESGIDFVAFKNRLMNAPLISDHLEILGMVL